MHRFTMVLLLGALIVPYTAGNAAAADMPSATQPPAVFPPIPYAPPAFSWTGFYVGGNFGWDWTRTSDTVTMTGAGTGSISGNVTGFLGGGQAGFNWQVLQPVVVGIEADFQGSQATAGRTSFYGAAGPAIITGVANTPYFGTVRGRIGYAYGTLMFYATGGGVYGESTWNGTVSTSGPFCNSATFWSWTAGVGIEAALGGHFSAKLEYLFIGSPSNSPLIPGETALTGTSGTNFIRAGLNYRF